MSTAIAMAPSPAPHDRPAFATAGASAAATDLPAPPPPPTATASAPTQASTSMPSPSAHRTTSAVASRSGSGSPRTAPAKSSPPSASRTAGAPPKIIVKKEPSSPDLPTARHRPRRLDLSKNTASGSPATARPLTARDGALGIQEVGIACLSPGFVTQDPVMKQQLERSMSVREQQRHIIEARLQQQSAKGDGPDHLKDKELGFAAKTPGMSRRNRAPPGLTIMAPSHEQFANERVIQSAPLGQTFTGRHNALPLTRHITNQPSNLSNTSHIHHVPATQTNNRLPPIADVFGPSVSGHPDNNGHSLYASQSRGPLTSPVHPPPPPPQQAPTPGRPRDYKSAEEAQAELAGGRPELLPKLVHYGGHQPPTPPSPQTLGNGIHGDRAHADAASRSASSSHYPNLNNASNAKRRTRAEYEDGGSPPLGNGRPPQQARRAGPFGEGRDSPETQRAKREEFLRLCERAWDLFHS